MENSLACDYAHRRLFEDGVGESGDRFIQMIHRYRPVDEFLIRRALNVDEIALQQQRIIALRAVASGHQL